MHDEEYQVVSDFQPAERLKCLKASEVRRFFALAEEMPDAINLSVGEPDFSPPKHILDASSKAARRAKHIMNLQTESWDCVKHLHRRLPAIMVLAMTRTLRFWSLPARRKLFLQRFLG